MSNYAPADVINALLSGYQWSTNQISYTILTSVPSYYGQSGDPGYPVGFQALNSELVAAVQQSLMYWSSVANIQFVSSAEPNVGQITFGRWSIPDDPVEGPINGTGQLPIADPSGGDVWFNSASFMDSPALGNNAQATVTHEIGHALGLRHPFGQGSASSDFYTVMSYTSHDPSQSFWSYQPMLWDIAAVQSMYGANLSTATGNDSYLWVDGQTGFRTIWDAGGDDTLDASQTTTSNRISLVPGTASQIGRTDTLDNLSVAYLWTQNGQDYGWIENAKSGSGADTLVGNDLSNLLEGGEGFDTYYVGAGDEVLDEDLSGEIEFIDFGLLAGGTDLDRAGLYSNEEYTLFYVQDDTNGSVSVYSEEGELSIAVPAGTELPPPTIIDYQDGSRDVIGGLPGLGIELFRHEEPDDPSHSELDTGNVYRGTAADEMVWGDGGDNILFGADGNDNLRGRGGDDLLVGGNGNDFQNGEDGDDIFVGGSGNDTNVGGLGNDVYYHSTGYDDFYENVDAGYDVVHLKELTPDDIRIHRTGPDLHLRLVDQGGGTAWDQRLHFANAFWWDVYNTGGDILPTTYDEIVFSDGTVWTLADVKAAYLSGEYADSSSTLLGFESDDTIAVGDQGGFSGVEGLGGNDQILGGSGNDFYLRGGIGNDVIDGGGGRDWLEGGPGDDQLHGGSGASDLADDNLYGGDGNDVLYDGPGGDNLWGGNGDDTYYVVDPGVYIGETAGAGLDTIYAAFSFSLSSLPDAAEIEFLILTGSGDVDATGNQSANELIGTTGANTLSGLAGNDLLDGGGGEDTLVGGDGDDVLIVDSAGDIVLENLGEGNDTVLASISYVLPQNVENLTLTGLNTIDGTGNELGNTIAGNSANNVLDGSTGDDVLVGAAGDDMYIVDSPSDVIIEHLADGNDAVQSSVSYVLPSNVEALALAGSSAINGTGNELANTLVGNSGGNLLDGDIGDDTMLGGAGNDTYFVDTQGDVVSENADEGIDTVYSSVAYTLPEDVENLMLTGSAPVDATGNAESNILTGNSAANTVVGNAGDDTLDGGAGADTLAGGAGNDVYYVDDSADSVVELTSEGTDVVKSSIAFSLPSNVEELTLLGTLNVNGTGNALENVIRGNGGINVLAGGAGDDSYYVGTGDSVVENPGEGTDWVYSTGTHSLGANVENVTLLGTAAIDATGNALNNTLIGNAAANTLTGGAGDDTYHVSAGDTVVEGSNGGSDTIVSEVTWTLGANLENLTLTGTAALNATGNSLANVITGNDGVNTLTGGTGNDSYYVGAGDTVVEGSNAGTDTVYSPVSWTLGANLERLTLIGTANVDAIGNTLANLLTGNSGNNRLDGGSGSDTMLGGAGDDVYVVGATGDVVTENAGEGNDTVESAVTYTLGANLENLVLTGTANRNGTGNALDNQIIGNSGSNTLTGNDGNDYLDGGAGSDTMRGGAGDDTYVVERTTDSVTENAGAGTDAVLSTIGYTLGANVENLTLLGTSAINATGNALNNILTGNAGNNIISGAAGNDTLDGMAGTDTLAGGTGNDTYRIGRGHGAETVQENDSTSDIVDVGQFLDEVAADQIWFHRSGNDLVSSIIGTQDQMTIQNWYLGSQYRLEQFRTADGATVLDSQVQNLVDAMAAFAPPAPGQTTLPPDYALALAPVIAANWQ